MNPTEIQNLIRSEIGRRTERNPRYSLRAFARASGISHTVLSLVLSGKRPLSRKAALKLADFLSLEPTARRELLESRVAPVSTSGNYHQISLDTFAVISEWYHYAILSLLELEDARFEARWIARKLAISESQAKLAMDRLARLGLIAQRPDGSWKQSSLPLQVGNVISTAATRKFHRQLLEKALDAMEGFVPAERDFSSMTFAMDTADIEFAKSKIQKFRRELVSKLEARRGAPDAVFELTIQLFPVTRNPRVRKPKET